MIREWVFTISALAGAMSFAPTAVGQVAASASESGADSQSPRSEHQPYTAEYKLTRVKTQADGITVTTEFTEVVAVDSHGREMNSITRVPKSAEQTVHTNIGVLDPVSHTITRWSVPGTTASVLNAPDLGEPETECAKKMKAVSPLSPFAAGGQKPAIEDLGTKTIDGIPAHGGRITFINDAKNAGNTEPYERTNEMWSAIDPGLDGMRVRLLSDAGTFGSNTQELVKLTRGEPDPGIFKVPEDRSITARNGQAYCANNRDSFPILAPMPAQ